MKPAPFDYHRASSVEDAVDLLARTGGKVLAGGQSLVPMMSMRLASPPALIDINAIAGLDRIDVDETSVRIGATVRHRSLELHESAYAANPLLRQALSQVAHPTIRNRGTTVGSLIHGDPAAEMPAVLALLGGQVEVVGPAGLRAVEAGDLFAGPLESSVGPDEVAVAATFPHPPERSGTCWLELARRRGDYALVGVGAVVTLDADGGLLLARLGLVSVAGTPVVVDVTDAVGTDRDWTAAVDQVDAAIDPEADIHATAEYRRRLARVLSQRALTGALAAVSSTPAAA